jgi:hypothetical protein
MAISNPALKNYPFLQGMYDDGYSPDFLVDKCKQILILLCEKIEQQNPQNAEEVYKLTHAATEEFNSLAKEFEKNNSEIETAARDCIGVDFSFIVKAYGFDLDDEDVIAPREW